ncbi:MAG: HlyC/CorC family transporter, partial [Clostridia bacterium]|nr:HlyC/CorC family transporter [Clostridia bacterium]
EPEGEECDANTVGGWVCEKLENIPNINDSFDYENLRVTVLETDQTRVLTVRVEILPEKADDEKEE